MESADTTVAAQTLGPDAVPVNRNRALYTMYALAGALGALALVAWVVSLSQGATMTAADGYVYVLDPVGAATSAGISQTLFLIAVAFAALALFAQSINWQIQASSRK